MELYFPCDLLGLGKCACLFAFLTMAITIAMGINAGAPGWNILEWFQNNIRSVEMVCSITVIKQTFLWNSSRKVLDACSGKVLEQVIRIFLKLL